jgi:hypothetical protein
MKIQISHFKGQFLFLLGLTIPAVSIGIIYPTQANPLPTTSAAKKPFIDATYRYDSLKGLQTLPKGGINQQDGGTGKEASDDKKKESKDGKEQSEGGLILRGQERINPATFKNTGGSIRSQLPNQLLNSHQPII